MTEKLMHLPITAYQGDDKCEECKGTGVTGDRYELPTDGDVVILVDILCGLCGGCGRNSEHLTCAPNDHAEWEKDDDGWGEWDEDENGINGQCPSCFGRRWNSVQAVAGEGDAAEVVYMRVPCGCAEPLMAEQ